MVSFIKRSGNLQNIALFTALCIAVMIAAATPTPWAGKLAPQGVDKLFHTAGFAVLLMHMLMVRLKSGLVMAPLALVFFAAPSNASNAMKTGLAISQNFGRILWVF